MAKMKEWMDDGERERRRREYQTEYRKKHSKEAAEAVQRHRRRKKKQKILAVAPACMDCGEEDVRVLDVVETEVLCLNCRAIRRQTLTNQESVVPLDGDPVTEER